MLDNLQNWPTNLYGKHGTVIVRFIPNVKSPINSVITIRIPNVGGGLFAPKFREVNYSYALINGEYCALKYTGKIRRALNSYHDGYYVDAEGYLVDVLRSEKSDEEFTYVNPARSSPFDIRANVALSIDITYKKVDGVDRELMDMRLKWIHDPEYILFKSEDDTPENRAALNERLRRVPKSIEDIAREFEKTLKDKTCT